MKNRDTKSPHRAANGLYWFVLTGISLLMIFGSIVPAKKRLQNVRGMYLEKSREYFLLEKENTQMRIGLGRLTDNDPVLWEQVIRERLRWVGKDEVPAAVFGGSRNGGMGLLRNQDTDWVERPRG